MYNTSIKSISWITNLIYFRYIWKMHLLKMCCFNFFRNQLWQHLICYNSFKNVNMCLLEVVMFEKCRSSHFQSEGGVKSLRNEGLRNFRTGGGLLLLGGLSSVLQRNFILCGLALIWSILRILAYSKIARKLKLYNNFTKMLQSERQIRVIALFFLTIKITLTCLNKYLKIRQYLKFLIKILQ